MKHNDGHNPLSRASLMGHVDVVKLLIEQGADINAKNNYGGTPLHLASEEGYTEVPKLLNEKGAI